MPDEVKEYPHDFFKRKLSLVFVMRGTQKEPETIEDYFEALNMKAHLIGSLGYFLSAVNVRVFHQTDPTNFDCHIENLAFLIMSLADEIPDEAEHFVERFGLDK